MRFVLWHPSVHAVLDWMWVQCAVWGDGVADRERGLPYLVDALALTCQMPCCPFALLLAMLSLSSRGLLIIWIRTGLPWLQKAAPAACGSECSNESISPGQQASPGQQSLAVLVPPLPRPSMNNKFAADCWGLEPPLGCSADNGWTDCT